MRQFERADYRSMLACDVICSGATYSTTVSHGYIRVNSPLRNLPCILLLHVILVKLKITVGAVFEGDVDQEGAGGLAFEKGERDAVPRDVELLVVEV